MQRHRRARWLLIAPLTVVSTAGLIAAARPAPLRPCDLAVRWVAEHKAELPKTLSAIRLLPASYQRYVYVALSGPERVAIWRAHLDAYLAVDSALTQPQLQFVRDLEANLGAAVGDSVIDHSRTFIRSHQLKERAEMLFGRSKARDIFTLPLGIVNRSTTSSPSSEAQSGPNAESDIFFCGCNTGEAFWDCGSPSCTGGGCIPVSFGCGFLTNLTCDGACDGHVS
jgi:hypothetical protein